MGWVSWKTAVVSSALVLVPGPAQAADSAYVETVRPFLDNYCIDCHSGKKPEEGLRLDAPGGKNSDLVIPSLTSVDPLDRLASRLRARTMPPPDHDPQPKEAELAAVLGWIEGRIDTLTGSEPNPGRVTIRRLTKIDYRNSVRDLLGVEIDTADFPSDDVAHGFDNLADVISLPPLLMEKYLDAAQAISRQWFDRTVGEDQSKWPADMQSARDQAQRILVPILERAYRRPVTESERTALLDFFVRAQGLELGYREAMEASLQTILVSPHFLYRIEHDGELGQPDYRLNDFELAARLAYFLWNSLPDDELLAAAKSGKLQTGDVLDGQVRRMLRDPKVRTGLVENFVGQWLQLRRLEAIRPDRQSFGGFDKELRAAMREETLWLFETMVRQDRSVLDLLTAEETFVNERLAKHYGLKGITGKEFRQVSLKGTPRRGLLTQAGVLALTSNPTRTSPVKRGKYIMEAILGTPPPPPVADAGELEAVKVSGTLRQRLEQHRSNAQCASCHVRMDALGLAFEHFDAIGAWRTEDEGHPVDASGELPDGGKFKDALELIEILRTEHAETYRKNLATQMLIYALGRKLEHYDRPVIRRIHARMIDGGGRFSNLVLAIVHSDPFRLRRNVQAWAVADFPDGVLHETTGNPEQQMIIRWRSRPGADMLPERVAFQWHSLQPLLRAVADSGAPATIKPLGASGSAHRYAIEGPTNSPLNLMFIPGLLAASEYSDDFLMPVNPIAELAKHEVHEVGRWDQKWTSSLLGPRNPRPGTLYTIDFQATLVGKEKDRVDLFLTSHSGPNRSLFEDNDGPLEIEGGEPRTLTRVGRRRPTMHDAWNDNMSAVITARPDLRVTKLSPIRLIRPKLGLSDASPMTLGTVKANQPAESAARRLFNAQTTTLVDNRQTEWKTLLYGVARLDMPDAARPYNLETQHVGIELTGPHADRFELLGANVVDAGRGLKLLGADGQPGLEGGSAPEFEEFRVRFRGSDKPGNYDAIVRVVTQAGGIGTVSSGKPGEPQSGLYYVDIPITAVVQ